MKISVFFNSSAPKENDKIEEEAPLCRNNRRTTTADRIRYQSIKHSLFLYLYR